MGDFEIGDCDTIATHTAGHAHTDWYVRAETASDRTWLALRVLLTVRTRSSMEAVTLHDTLEAFTFGNSTDHNHVASLELRDLELIANLLSWGVETEFTQRSE